MPDLVAAVDLGSNSFHMLVARVVDGEVHVVDRLKERVALAEGLQADKTLSDDAQRRAIDCLERFGQRLEHMTGESVRAVGTNTLRAAKNARRFLEQAEAALGHRIEIISGREEARLVYLGVANTLSRPEGRRLVVDIGGGSTECIIGETFEPRLADSLYMGHITWTQRYFGDGKITAAAMADARTAAALEAESIQQEYRKMGWEEAVGASGTILAIDAVVRANGWGDSITPKALKKMRKALIQAGRADKIQVEGLQEARKPVIAGGLAILSAVFDILDVESMTPSEGAVREGVVYDMVGRMSHRDVRESTVRQLEERYNVDRDQAARVERTAMSLLDDAADDLELDVEWARDYLRWASRLHEIGVSLSYSGYHKHGGYILEHTDMPGFSRDAQQVLARMVTSHRRKLRVGRFEDLPSEVALPAVRLTILLRLAVRMNRGRSDAAIPKVHLAVEGEHFSLRFPTGWLEENPLTRADLEREKSRLQSAGYSLSFA
jgi:exopolyphosphatase/guanosine-5'-triphosphate,3'-diphosphate pyrophosphatase